MSLHLAILGCAARLVPSHLRGAWFAEWKAELWYVRRNQIGFCLGAFPDAFWLWRNNPHPATHRLLTFDSPFQCGISLAILAAAAALVAFVSPDTRKAFLPSPYRQARDLVLITPVGTFAAEIPTVSVDQYEALRSRGSDRFAGLAFYRPTVSPVRSGRTQTPELSVAVASANLFELLDLPVSRKHTATLVLSHSAWRKYFGGDPHIAGRVVEVAGQRALVAGIISDDSWRLPGRTDAWLLVDAQRLAALPRQTLGFVLAHARTPPHSHPEERWRLYLPKQDGDYDRFECQSLAMRIRGPFTILMATVCWACLVFPATTSLSLGEYPANRSSHPWARRLRQWIFLFTKVALILSIVYFGSVDLAHLGGSSYSAGIQTVASAAGCLFGFRWSLIDQRRRCPVCLRLLTKPARIGEPSRNFLEWYATELICARGHGLLHVPESPTSWFRTQRWLNLDASWTGLFSETTHQIYDN